MTANSIGLENKFHRNSEEPPCWFVAVFGGIEIVNVASSGRYEARLVDGSFLPHPGPLPLGEGENPLVFFEAERLPVASGFLRKISKKSENESPLPAG